MENKAPALLIYSMELNIMSKLSVQESDDDAAGVKLLFMHITELISRSEYL